MPGKKRSGEIGGASMGEFGYGGGAVPVDARDVHEPPGGEVMYSGRSASESSDVCDVVYAEAA